MACEGIPSLAGTCAVLGEAQEPPSPDSTCILHDSKAICRWGVGTKIANECEAFSCQGFALSKAEGAQNPPKLCRLMPGRSWSRAPASLALQVSVS